jgi:hypothetical protein
MRILALGSSQLGMFKQGVDLLTATGTRIERLDFAGIWETGFGYLYLDGSRVLAPDMVPELNNPRNKNLKDFWFVRGTNQVPDLDSYDLILFIASPCKLFSAFFYPSLQVMPLSDDILKTIIFSDYMNCRDYDSISKWHFRVSPVIGQVSKAFPKKTVFIGAPLPIEGGVVWLEALRAKLLSSENANHVHMQNIAKARRICKDSIFGDGAGVKVVLPPAELLCDMQISTKSQYGGSHNSWHADEQYGFDLVNHLCSLSLL